MNMMSLVQVSLRVYLPLKVVERICEQAAQTSQDRFQKLMM